MLMTRRYFGWIVVAIGLMLLSGCVGGIGSATSRQEQMEAEARFEMHIVKALEAGGFIETAEFENCLSEPITLRVEMAERSDTWILLDIPVGEWRSVNTVTNVGYQAAIQIGDANNDIYTDIGSFWGGGKFKVEANPIGDVPFSFSNDWDCK
jgi:hypothetical protein